VSTAEIRLRGVNRKQGIMHHSSNPCFSCRNVLHLVINTMFIVMMTLSGYI